jgi:hypothetical protein
MLNLDVLYAGAMALDTWGLIAADCGCPVNTGTLVTAAITIWGVTAWNLVGMYAPRFRHRLLWKVSRRYRRDTVVRRLVEAAEMGIRRVK